MAAALLLVLFGGNKGGGKLKSQTTEYDANGKVITKMRLAEHRQRSRISCVPPSRTARNSIL